MVAVCERNAGVVQAGDDGRDAGHDFEGNFRRRQFTGFLAPAAEDVGIATLEPHDAFALARLGDDERGQIFLRDFVAIAARDEFGLRPGEPEQGAVDEQVVNDHIRATEQFGPAQRQQAGITGAGSDQINCA